MINFKGMAQAGIVLCTILIMYYCYTRGVAIGIYETKLDYEAANVKAVRSYQVELKRVVDEHNRSLEDVERQYSTELSFQTTQAAEFQEQLRISDAQVNAVKWKIENVKSNCNIVGDDAHGLYKQTRSIVADPRDTEP